MVLTYDLITFTAELCPDLNVNNSHIKFLALNTYKRWLVTGL
jgi:hypothetical protein